MADGSSAMAELKRYVRIGEDGETELVVDHVALHDEAMRMQALAIGAQLVISQLNRGTLPPSEGIRPAMFDKARRIYREATGRERPAK
jgi:hypothetical protein